MYKHHHHNTNVFCTIYCAAQYVVLCSTLLKLYKCFVLQVSQKDVKELRERLSSTQRELQQLKMNMIEISEEAHV
jgi:hypothetical protein